MITSLKDYPSAKDYTVGILYVKPIEMDAAVVMLDERYPSASITIAKGDRNAYTLGKIGAHNVAIVGPPIGAQGKVAMANVAAYIHQSFPNMTLGLLVGIGGGVPSENNDVRLGDVVVGAPEFGPQVVQYDLGRRTAKGFEITRQLNKAPGQLLQLANKVRSNFETSGEGIEGYFLTHLSRFTKMKPNFAKRYARPQTGDRLFKAEYIHEDNTKCSDHDKSYLVARDHRDPPDEPAVFFSTILSGDSVMKDTAMRDQIAGSLENLGVYDALCFEMEAAGLMDSFPCLIVRGISDYCDSHKGWEWQGYAAATAAAYAREILLNLPGYILDDSRAFRDDPGQNFKKGEEAKPAPWSNTLEPGARSSNNITFYGNGNSGIQTGQNFGSIIWNNKE